VNHEEDDLQVQTAALFAHLGWLAWHTPNERASRRERIKLAARGVMPGIPDWHIAERYDSGFGIVIELKSATGRLSPEQRRVLDRFRQRGYLVAVCRTMDEVLDVLRRVVPIDGRCVR
jgi:hypothetical protein